MLRFPHFLILSPLAYSFSCVHISSFPHHKVHVINPTLIHTESIHSFIYLFIFYAYFSFFIPNYFYIKAIYLSIYFYTYFLFFIPQSPWYNSYSISYCLHLCINFFFLYIFRLFDITLSYIKPIYLFIYFLYITISSFLLFLHHLFNDVIPTLFHIERIFLSLCFSTHSLFFIVNLLVVRIHRTHPPGIRYVLRVKSLPHAASPCYKFPQCSALCAAVRGGVCRA